MFIYACEIYVHFKIDRVQKFDVDFMKSIRIADSENKRLWVYVYMN